MVTEERFEELMGRAARSLQWAPSMADAVILRVQQAGAGRPEDWRPALRLTLWERVSLMSPARRAAIIALAIAALAVTGLAAEEAVRKVIETTVAPLAPPAPQPIEGEPVEVTVKFGTEPPIMWPPTPVTSAATPSTTTTGAATPSTTTTGTAATTMSGTVMATTTMSSSGGGGAKFFTPLQLGEMDSLIAQKKYKLVGTSETPQGTQRLYRFTFSDGSTKEWWFYLPLDGVKSLTEYSEKHNAYEDKRREAMRKAMLAGRYRLVNVELILSHRCLEVASGNMIRVQKIDLPDGTAGASAEEVRTPPFTPGATEYTFTEYETTWQQHLDAIKAGRRKLLDSEVAKNYWYEMTLDDGSKTLMSVGGNEPLPDKPQAAGPKTEENSGAPKAP